VRARLPRLSHVIGCAGARGADLVDYDDDVGRASPRFDPVGTQADDPALIVYTSGTTGPPKGALMPHRCLIGNLPGFVASHDGYPKPRDLFWSPADWAWTGGIMDALLPTLYFGQPIVGYRGRFDAERALRLIEKYQVRNTFLFPTALKLIMKAFPRPRERFDVDLRTIMSAGESVGTTVFEWARDALGVTINEMFGQTEMNYIVGNSSSNWPAKAGSMGRPYPGHRVAVVDDEGREVARGDTGDVALNRIAPDGTPDPVFFLEYLGNEQATRGKYVGDWCRTGDMATMDEDGYLWYQGRADDMFKVAGYRVGTVRDRELHRQAPGRRERRGDPHSRRDARQRGEGVRRARRGTRRRQSARGRHPAARAQVPRTVRVSEGDRVPRRAADDDDRQGAAEGAARTGKRETFDVSGAAFSLSWRTDTPVSARPPCGEDAGSLSN
jgi:acetyl-CoA synthetase